MARKKRLDTASVLNEQKKSVLAANREVKKSNIFYNTGLYVRLSVADNGKEDGDSLENQVALVSEYIAGKDEFILYKMYVDNGESGVEFERPAFEEMIEDMKAGKINCIIVKDLSRLGRNYLESGTYIEQIFPFYRVRFISILDDYDSIRANAMDEGVVIPLKNIINESYAKDISKKVSSSFDVKMRQGKFLGSYAPYGYKKDPADKGHLLIDENVADNVWQIFRWKLEGASLGEIARKLNESGVSAPYRYFYESGLLGTARHKESIWNRVLVRRLLMKRVYIGDMVSGKERSSIVTGMKKKTMPEDEWFVVEGTHEAIVSKEDYDAVQQLLWEGKEKHEKIAGSYGDYQPENLFSRKLKCGNCGSAIKLIKYVKKNKHGRERRWAIYNCCRFTEYKEEGCKQVKIKKDELDQAVLENLKHHIRLFVDVEQVIRKLNRMARILKMCDGFEKQIRAKESRIIKLESLSSGIYEDLREEIIDEKEYLNLRKVYSEEINLLRQAIQELLETKEKYKPDYKNTGKLADVVDHYQSLDSLTKDIVDAFIEKITVYEDNRIKITFKFEDEFEPLLRELEKRKGEAYDG